MFWYPQTPHTVFQACRNRLLFFETQDDVFWKCSVCVVNLNFCFPRFGKHQIDAERNSVQRSCRVPSRTLI